jgi:hypothetical protein
MISAPIVVFPAKGAFRSTAPLGSADNAKNAIANSPRVLTGRAFQLTPKL